MATVSWLRWRLVQYVLVAFACAVTLPNAFGAPVAAAVSAGIALTVLAAWPTSGTLAPGELVLKAPLRTVRLPLGDIALTRPGFLPFAKVRRHGRWSSWPVPYTGETERFFAQVEQAQW